MSTAAEKLHELPETPREPDGAERARLAEFAEALGVVLRLFDRELDTATVRALAEPELWAFLAGVLDDSAGREAVARLKDAVDALPETPDQAVLDRLAADYADIFLTHGHRAAPSASVWLTDDHTERGEPMFAARRWYAHWGVKVPDWRKRPDDHIVPMLQFVSLLLETASGAALVDAAVFLDTQMGPWVGNFLGRVAQRADTALYRAAAEFAGVLLSRLRAELERITGVAERIPEPPKRAASEPEAVAYVPGAAPSW